MAIKTDARQIVSRDFLDQLTVSSAHAAAVVGGKRADETQTDDLFTAINSDLTVPIRMVATDPVDLVITLDAATLTNPGTGRSHTMYPIDDVVSTFAGGTITFSATFITPSVGVAIPMATSNSAFNKLGVYIDSSGAIVLVEGTEGASVALAVAPPEQPGMTYVGYITYEVDGGGNVVNISNGDIFQFVAPSTGLAGIVNQDRGMKLLGGGNWSVAAGPVLSWDAHAYLQVPGMANDRNRINVAASGVAIATDQVAYVDINRIDPGVATDLAISVVGIASFVNMNDRVIIARENDGSIIVGDDSFRIIVGESQTLEASASNETLALLGSGVTEATAFPTYAARGAPERTIDDSQAMLEGMSSIDAELDKWFGQLRLEPHATDAHRATVTGVDFTMKDGTTLSQEIASLVMEFTGAIINFTTGEILQDDDATPLGINFTPTVIPINEYHWYSLSLVAATQDATTEAMEVQFVVLPASGTDAVAADAPYAPFGGSKKLGQVRVQNLAGLATVGTIRQLGVGSGGGGNDQDRNLKLIEGGTWSVAVGNELTWDADAYIQVPGQSNDRNTISANPGGTAIANGECAYVEINRLSGIADILPVVVDTIENISPYDPDFLIIARGVSDGIVVGNNSFLLIPGESMTLEASSSDQTLTYIGATDQADSDPAYSSTNKLVQGSSLTDGLSALDSAAGTAADASNQDRTMKLLGGGNWSVTAGPVLNWDAHAYLQIPGMANNRNRINVAASGVAIAADQVAYVDLNRIDPGVATDLAISVIAVTSYVQTDDRLVIARENDGAIIVGDDSFRLIPGESQTLEASSSNETLAYIGATDESDLDPAYASIKYLTQSASLTVGAGELDAALFQTTTQDRNMKMIAGGIFSVTAGPILNWSASAYIQVPGLVDTDNTIAAGSIALAANQVATIEVNRTASGPALSVVATDMDALVVTDQTVIMARRDGADIIVGTHSFRLKVGEALELDGALAEMNRFHDQFRIRPGSTTNEISVGSADTTMLDGTILRQELNNFVVDFTGATIDFTAGTSTLGITGLDPIGTAIPATGEYKWFGIGLLPDTVGADNKMTPQFIITPAASSNATQANAPLPVVSGDKKLGAVLLQNLAGAAVVIEINRFSVGASGGGGGDANTFLEKLTNMLEDSFYEALTPNIFSQDADAKLDGASTGAFSLVTQNFEFTGIGQTMVSTQSLDAEFLAGGDDVGSVTLGAKWDLDVLDPAAIYEISRDAGVEYQAVSMNRVGNTDTFVGEHLFTEELTDSTIDEYTVANADGVLDLDDGTVREQIGQSFTLTDTSVVKVVTPYINVVGSPLGLYGVKIVADNAGSPSIDPIDVLSSSPLQDVTALVAGNNTVAVNMPKTILPAGTYHLVLFTDAAYKISYSVGVDAIAARTDSSAHTQGADLKVLAAAVWSTSAGEAMTYLAEGRVHDLRLKITSSVTDASLVGYGILYDSVTSGIATGIKNLQVFQFDSVADNDNEFTLTQYIPDPDLLNVYYVEAGQVFRYGAYVLDGQKIVFPVNTFNNGGVPSTVTIICDQTRGGSFDNSDQNATLLATNFLGSTDATFDRSVAGRGIFLRRPDGLLRELTIDNTDSIAIFSV